jgi:hypothetical protein
VPHSLGVSVSPCETTTLFPQVFKMSQTECHVLKKVGTGLVLQDESFRMNPCPKIERTPPLAGALRFQIRNHSPNLIWCRVASRRRRDRNPTYKVFSTVL